MLCANIPTSIRAFPLNLIFTENYRKHQTAISHQSRNDPEKIKNTNSGSTTQVIQIGHPLALLSGNKSQRRYQRYE